ncbi:hypothetical protein GKE82_03775 [Conexibacter sp. W3-3-2]|nr:hypothetical protein [Conexibacter sp. W3-3-2]
MSSEDTTGSPAELPPAWQQALLLLDRELRGRAAAEKTRRAYGIDVEQFARWATAAGLEPREVEHRALRRYAAKLGEDGAAPTTVARKLAAIRSLFRSLREHGLVEQNPADLVASPKRPRTLPTVLKPAEIAALLDRIPTSTPLELRDRAMFELAYACGLRAEGDRDARPAEHRLRRRAGPRRGQGRQDPPRARRGGRARRGRPLPGTCPPRARRRGAGCGTGAVPLEVRPASRHVGRPPAAARLGAARRGPGRGASARPPSLVRDAPAGRRGRPARDPGDARTRERLHDPDLHSGRVSASQDGVRAGTPASLTRDGDPGWRRTSKRSN